MFKKSLFAGIYVAIFIIGCNLKAATPFTIEYEKYTLDNGLTVILHTDKSDPIIGVAIQYHVGSNRETPGRTGFAHLFEHMLFQESQHVARTNSSKKFKMSAGRSMAAPIKMVQFIMRLSPKMH